MKLPIMQLHPAYIYLNMLNINGERPSNASYAVRFEVFTAVTMKYAVFWDVAERIISIFTVEKSGDYSAATCSRWFFARGFFYREGGDDTFLRNVGLYITYTVSHPRRRYSSSLILFAELLFQTVV
jgi:hypothetical protein